MLIIFRQRIWLLFLLGYSVSITSNADLSMEKTIIISPKTGPATANIIALGTDCEVKMKDARVEITVGEPQQSREDLIELRTYALFHMRNVSRNQLAVTVGFPVSDSEYSACELKDFAVSSNMEDKSVFNRVTGYPSRLVHKWVSGPKSSPDILPDTDAKVDLFGNYRDIINKDEKLGAHGGGAHPRLRGGFFMKSFFILDDIFPGGGGCSSTVHNLMVWREDFMAGEERVIEVRYAMEIPIQKNRTVTKNIRTNAKGIPKEAANNCPVDFLQTLKKGDYYFFDYFLTSGASWKGPIGRETITLNFPVSWSGKRAHCNKPERLIQTDSLTWTYTLINEEPTENLYFAVPADSRRVL